MKNGYCPICGERLELNQVGGGFWYECSSNIGHTVETVVRKTIADAERDVEWNVELPPLTKAVGIVALILACSAIAALVPYSLTRFIIASAAPLWVVTVVVKRFKGRG